MPLQSQFQQLFIIFLQLMCLLFNPFFIIPAIIIIIILIDKSKDYKNSAYYQITKQPYFSVKRDIGKYGEYLTYKYLRNFETVDAKFLFNIYIPKENYETTEIDVLMISHKGIFVIESKNYSGWIFGSESQKNWYQTLPKGKNCSHKVPFYNPIMQNRSHIKYLKALLGEQIPMRSIIVFSDRCVLKHIKIYSNDISVINRYNVAPVITEIYNQTSINLLTEKDIADIYNKLYPYTQVDEITKIQHITKIRNNLNSQAIQRTGIVPINESIHFEKTNPTEQQTLKCPICNCNLILRTATKGANAGKQFYRCSNYPKCEFIKNL